MHAIKSQARKHAWADHGKDTFARYLPYADRRRHQRVPSSGMKLDMETAPSQSQTQTQMQDGYATNRIHSESCVQTLQEIRRHGDNNNHALPRSGTEPSGASPTAEKKGKQSTGTSGDTLVPSSSSSEDSVPKKRMPFFHRKSTETPDLEKSDSRISQIMSRKSSKKHENLSIRHQLKSVFWSWPNVLLICVPIGIGLNYAKPSINPLAIFIVNFIAIIPLAGTLSYATEEIAMRVGETLGGLLNASFGNATELITAIIALAKGQITIVQTSLVGSMLSNLLLVMGMCFAFGGYNRPEQHFNMTVAQTACSLLILAGASLIIPTAFQQMSSAPDNLTQPNIPKLSRGTAIILLFVYACYLFFQLRTHVTMYNAPSEKVQKQNLVRRSTAIGHTDKAAVTDTSANSPTSDKTDTEKNDQQDQQSQEDEDEEVPNLSFAGGIITLCVATALIGLCSEFVVDNINAVAVQNNVPLEFIGLILLPIVGNAAEHATAVTVAIKDKMDLAIGVAVGSSLQIALLVLPVSVVIGWIVGPVTPTPPLQPEGPMTLNFDGFIIAILFVTILLVNFLIGDGKSHWLEGVMLMTTYIIIAVAAWFYPDPPGLGAD